MKRVHPPRHLGWPLKLAGDKGYSVPRIRRWLERRMIDAVIPQRSDEIERDGELPLDRDAYRRRSNVERAVGWLKECRRLGTRFEKLATTFLSMVYLGMIQRYFRMLAP
jgi:transposase